ncbi:Filamin-A [Portunus trituberculatus]|uniref:Filamin-A n=1 Tax=Portunus trituberculatus TaxID=210409 RepID=A0A5B7HGH9_PORTR|nr:Filamin-A [Portunus trituberculatus]
MISPHHHTLPQTFLASPHHILLIFPASPHTVLAGGVHETIKTKQIDTYTSEYTYQPKKEGRYIVMVSYGGQEIPKSPFEVNIGPYKETRIRAYGPGLKGGVVGYPALFTAETNGEVGTLGQFSRLPLVFVFLMVCVCVVSPLSVFFFCVLFVMFLDVLFVFFLIVVCLFFL